MTDYDFSEIMALNEQYDELLDLFYKGTPCYGFILIDESNEDLYDDEDCVLIPCIDLDELNPSFIDEGKHIEWHKRRDKKTKAMKKIKKIVDDDPNFMFIRKGDKMVRVRKSAKMKLTWKKAFLKRKSKVKSKMAHTKVLQKQTLGTLHHHYNTKHPSVNKARDEEKDSLSYKNNHDESLVKKIVKRIVNPNDRNIHPN